MRIIKYLKKIKKNSSLLNFIFNLFFHPKMQFEKYFLGSIKLLIYTRNTLFLKKISRHLKSKVTLSNQNLFICAGKSIESSWIQIWITLSLLMSDKIGEKYVLTSKKEILHNIYFLLFGFKLLFIENLKKEIIYPKEFLKGLEMLNTVSEIEKFEFQEIPFGRMALSTYCRSRKTGIIDHKDKEFGIEIKYLIKSNYLNYTISKNVYAKYKIKHLFFSEVFMDEYGGYYYSALTLKLNIIRFNGTVRDNAAVITRMTRESDRTHFSSFSKKSWARISIYKESKKYVKSLNSNFEDRYSEKWFLSNRNQPNTKLMTKDEMHRKFSIPKNKKIAIIYSHILFDLLYFHGKDIFENYADWFVETIKEITKNENLIWFIKIHPSNIWRGEINKFYGIKTEEELLIKKTIKKLPKHVKLIFPDSEISPLSWMKFTDYGITVRGTSGIELAALGKQVLIAGTGRYEEIGFTINPKSKKDYLNKLSKIHLIKPLTKKQVNLAKLFAYATFCMKPITFDYMRVSKLIFKKSVKTFEHLNYLPIKEKFKDNKLPLSVIKFKKWMFESDEIDFLNDF